MIICVKGYKVGDSLIREEDGSLLPVYPDTFYPRNVLGYWNLKRIGNYWVIIKVLL